MSAALSAQPQASAAQACQSLVLHAQRQGDEANGWLAIIYMLHPSFVWYYTMTMTIKPITSLWHYL